MCVILVPTKRHPTPDELNDAQEANPHGAGMAWKNQDGKLSYEKAIDAKRVWEIIQTEKPKIPYIIHFRIASVGGVCDKLTHPFPVNQSVSLKKQWQGKSPLLFHNGTWSDWKEAVMPFSGHKDFPRGSLDDWSDSRALAYLAYKTKRGFFNFIDEKVAIMEKNGEVNLYGSWQRNDTLWCSNLNHVRAKHTITYGRNSIYGNNTWNDDYWGIGGNYNSRQKDLYATQKLRDDIDGAV